MPLVRGEEVRGGGSTGAGGRRRLFTAEAALRRVGAAVSGIGRISEPRGTRSRGWLESREDRGGGSAWRPWAAAPWTQRRAPWRREKLGSALEKGKGVERGSSTSAARAKGEETGEGGGEARSAVAARRRRGASTSILGVRAGDDDAWRLEKLQEGTRGAERARRVAGGLDVRRRTASRGKQRREME